VPADKLDWPKLRSSLLLALVASLAFGVANFCQKIGLMHGAAPQAMLVGQVTVFMPATVLGVLALDRKIAIPGKTVRVGFFAAVALLCALIAFLIGLRSGEASVVAPIAQMGFIVTAALGVTMLREPITPRKAVGLVFAIAALGAFAI
jgi:transporter family protein